MTEYMYLIKKEKSDKTSFEKMTKFKSKYKKMLTPASSSGFMEDVRLFIILIMKAGSSPIPVMLTDLHKRSLGQQNLPLAAYYHLFINYILYYIISLTLKSKVCIRK